jgi:hypothetical protein
MDAALARRRVGIDEVSAVVRDAVKHELWNNVRALLR